MSQEAILQTLENGRELTRSEIEKKTGLSRASINRGLRRLIKYNEIEKKFSDKPLYKIKKKREGNPHSLPDK